MRLGVYFIPEKGPFYEVGSKVVGYDIRGGQRVKQLDPILPKFTERAIEYGFHMTLTDVVEVDQNQLDEAVQFLRSVSRFFPRETAFELTQVGVDSMPDDPRQLAIKFEASEAVKQLQTLLVCMIQMKGKESIINKKLKSNPRVYFPNDPHKREKTAVFLSPYCLTDYLPHFTLVNPLPDDLAARTKIREMLQGTFSPYKDLAIDSLCLVVSSGDDFFKIYEEIPLRVHD